MHAQTGDAAVRERVRYIVGELAAARRRTAMAMLAARPVEARRRGSSTAGSSSRSSAAARSEPVPFDVNGGWVPLYAWHKVHAGLIEAFQHRRTSRRRCRSCSAWRPYLAEILEPLWTMPRCRRCWWRNMAASTIRYAETHALTGNPRWLRLAERDPATAACSTRSPPGATSSPATARQHPVSQADRPGAALRADRRRAPHATGGALLPRHRRPAP